ncbi:MAG TPA: ATP-binding protein [Bacteroidales bacterium]|nr:ATP-binding protein [Bacteroidales bacterium]
MAKNFQATEGYTYIKKLISEGEHTTLDFKFEISNSRKIARTLVAFANTQGGRLLIGVKDNGAIAGVRSEEEFYMIEAAASMYCKPEIHIVVRPWLIEQKTVLEVIVEKNPKLCYAKDENNKWIVIVRINDQNIVANRVYVEAQKIKRNKNIKLSKVTETEQLILANISDYKHVSISKLSRLLHLTIRQTEDALINLIAREMIAINLNDKEITYSGK